MGTSPDQLRAEIEDTRARLTKDLDRLADRVSPRRVAGRQGRRLRGTATGLRERVMGTATEGTERARERTRQAGESVRETAEQAGEAARRAPEQVVRRAEGNPLAAGLVAFGAGLLAASMVPETEAERQAAARLAEQAEQVTEPVKGAARESAERLKESASGIARQEAKRTAEEIRERRTEGPHG